MRDVGGLMFLPFVVGFAGGNERGEKSYVAAILCCAPRTNLLEREVEYSIYNCIYVYVYNVYSEHQYNGASEKNFKDLYILNI